MPKALKTKTEPKPKGKSPSGSRQKDSRPRPDEAPCPSAGFSSSAKSLAASSEWRLVQDGEEGEEEYFVLSVKDPNMQSLMDADNLLKFDPPDNKELLKDAKYDRVTDQKVFHYGNGGRYTLFVFRFDSTVWWMTKTSFNKVFKGKANTFEEDAERLRLFHAATSDDNDVGEGPSRSGGITDIKRETEVESDDEGAAQTEAGSNVDSEEESDTSSGVESTNECEPESDTVPPSDDDDDDTPVSSVPVSKGKTRKSTTQQVNGKSFLYAREVDGKWQTITEKDGLYDMEERKNPPQYCRHREKKIGYAPSVDKVFGIGMSLGARGKGVDVTKYALLGCVGFKRGRGTVWKAAILKITDQELKKKLQIARTEAGCTYTGPLLLPWTQFKDAFGRDKKRAERLFDKTTLGKALEEEKKARKAKGLPSRRARHETFEPEAMKPLYDRFDQVVRQNQKIIENAAKDKAEIRELIGLLKSKL